MKILLWSQYFWPENFRINELAKTLHHEGVNVTVLTGKPNYPDGKIFAGYKLMGIVREGFAGVEVIRIPLLPRGKASSSKLILNYLSFIFSGLLFAPFVLRGRPFDAIFVYAPSPLLQALPAVFLAWIKRAPLVVWVQDLWPDALQSTGHVKNRCVLWPIELAVRYIYRSADSILIQSEGFRPSVESLLKDNGKIHYYPNSTDDILVESEVAPKHISLARDIDLHFSVVFAGNIGRAQSCETIINAAKLVQGIKNLRFYLIGDGSLAETIRENIADNRMENVVMTGRIPAEDMAQIYASASVLLLSLRDDPGLSATIPSKLQSYLAAGKPIIASSNGESANVVKRAEAGFSCPAGNAEALAEAVLRLYEMLPVERARFGENGRKYFLANYNMPDRVRELIAHFKNISHS